MGAPGMQARKRGTGRIGRLGDTYVVYGPATKGRATYVGSFPSRYEARKALERWLRERNIVWPVA